ncbi:flagellar hook-basal body complex protein FliE [Fusibacter ferrireducens]|uniref:Flagellar hook-basal body complex protein FliE n=1 Tax=Fusibacter ferrireducens TaxID=2785058 RepID=A0ABR9ZMQ4_9FIRM|nr:flagellar hook-basal body complex protein FliE [Fusibacter ferrireducens]MBF4691721.1 flagellar hook-basal body complex protein FliE [Fusibacter ferrireducens]
MAILPLGNEIIPKNQKIIDVNNAVNDRRINFQDLLVENLQKVSDAQLDSEKMDKLFAIGEVDNIHDVSIASMKADLTISLAVELTNKVLAAYSEIMRLQV